MANDNEPRPRRHVCSCGFAAKDSEEFDDHMLLVFTTSDSVGVDGKKHVAGQSSSAVPASYVG